MTFRSPPPWALLVALACAPVTSTAQQTRIEAQSGSVAAQTITNSQITINADLTNLPAFVKAFSDQLQASQTQLAEARLKRDEIAAELNLTREAVEGFFKILGETHVPPEKQAEKLREVVAQFTVTRQRLAALDFDEPAAKALAERARAALDLGRLDEADALLRQAGEAELVAAEQSRVLAAQAQAAADAKQGRAAAARESRGDIALTQRRYREAAAHFGAAAGMLPGTVSGGKASLLWRQADALYRQGDELGDNPALIASITTWHLVLAEYPRGRVPLDWAMTQNNLGTALAVLGARESGTARLEEAAAAYRLALMEWTRDRVPLNWAMAQNNLGNALRTLGERESGTARLEEAAAAYRLALTEQTRDRVPLNWAMTQNNLGNALAALGERESGTARLEEAVAAFRLALMEYTRDRVPLNWAFSRHTLGNVLAVLAERTGDRARLVEAITCMRDAAQVYREGGNSYWLPKAEGRIKELETALAGMSK